MSAALPIDTHTLTAAAEAGLRLEIMNGLAAWEARPAYPHQKAVERIAASLRRVDAGAPCACVHALGVYLRFPAGLKRPDAAVFCTEPSDAEQDETLTPVPEAVGEVVGEVVSKGFEANDLESGPPFYPSQGVKDVLVFDPSTLLVPHVRRDGARRMTAPALVAFECGCEVQV